MYDVIVYVRKVLWEEIKKHMVGVSSQICLRASLVKSGCFTDLETLQMLLQRMKELTTISIQLLKIVSECRKTVFLRPFTK